MAEAVRVLFLDGDRSLLERVLRRALLCVEMPAEEGAEREDHENQD